MQIFILSKTDLSSAIVVINSFDIHERIFKSNISNIIKDIKSKKIKRLIIDLRNNRSGSRVNAIELYSYLAKAPFKQIKRESTVALKIPERKFASEIYINEKEFLENKFKNHPTFDGWSLTFDDLQMLMTPKKSRFEGKIFVLVGGNTFSAAAAFGVMTKNNPEITLIGEDSGGGYHASNSLFPVHYELPNSKIKFALNMIRLDHFTKNSKIPKGSSLSPDKYISLNPEHLILGKDPQLAYLFRLFEAKR